MYDFSESEKEKLKKNKNMRIKELPELKAEKRKKQKKSGILITRSRFKKTERVTEIKKKVI
jgi:hypothetical protein